MSSYCTCTHAIELHQHDRAGMDCATCDCAAAHGHLATAWTQFADEVADAIEHATAEYDPATDYPEPEDDWEMAR